MARITINGISLDPVAHAQDLATAGLASPDAAESDYILIQTSAPLTTAQKDELGGMGVAIQEYVSENTYLCGYKGTDLARIRALPYVTWANVYLRGFKVAPNLRPPSASSTAHILPVSAGAPNIGFARPNSTASMIFWYGIA